MIGSILLSILLIGIFLAMIVAAIWIGARNGWQKGYWDGRRDAVIEAKRFEDFRRERIAETVASKNGQSRLFIAQEHFVIQTKTGLKFGVYTNKNVLAPAEWEPDQTLALVLADRLEEHRWLK